jgi:ATP-binding cassette subfamily C protein CydCD
VLDEGRAVQRGRYAELVAVDGPLRDMAERESESDLLVAAR